MKKEELKVTKEEGTITVSKTLLDHTVQKQEKIEIRPFITSTATVGVNISRTINLGNYENLRLGLLVSVPCYKEEIVDVFKQTLAVAERLMDEELIGVSEKK